MNMRALKMIYESPATYSLKYLCINLNAEKKSRILSVLKTDAT